MFQLDNILERHGIAPKFKRAFRILAEQGRIDDLEFRTRLQTCINYQAARDEILELLTPVFKVPFESL